MTFLHDFKKRGLFSQSIYEEELVEHLKAPRAAYAGFDPTASSLHAGHLLPVINLMRWQKAGHKAIILLGGGTGYIGDPTGKTEMRSMLTLDSIQQNVESISKQLSSMIDISSPERGVAVNNGDWLRQLNYLDFLRDFGPHFNVNKMIHADCYASRMDSGLTFLEFNYMLLQSYDFFHLYKNQNCTIQLGGDDQWSNMLGGVTLIRKLEQKPVFCITSPLLVTSSGKKMGKTEKGAVWLDPNMTSPYEFFQYWRNADDADVAKLLNFMTFLPHDEIEHLSNLKDKEINHAKEVLAFEVTKTVHGEQEATKAREQARSVFSQGGSADAPTVEVDGTQAGEQISVIEIMFLGKICASKGEARKLIEGGGVYVKGERVTDVKLAFDQAVVKADNEFILQKGKKNFYKIVLN